MNYPWINQIHPSWAMIYSTIQYFKSGYISCIFILYPVSCIQYPVSGILYPVSCIQYPVSSILYPWFTPLSNTLNLVTYPVFVSWRRIGIYSGLLGFEVSWRKKVSCIQYPVSSILYPVSCIQYPVSSILYPVSCIQYPISSIQYPV